MIITKHKLAIGTAQFGMPYGISNTHGQVSLTETKKILSFAKDNGIHTLDTAIGYGNSESRLGEVDVSGFQVISKLLAVPPETPDISQWVEKNICSSLERLRLPSLYGVLLHKPAQLLDSAGTVLYESLQKLKELKLVSKIGISIYSPQELDRLMPVFDFDIIQAPFNVFDRRLAESGWLDKLAARNIEVHVRSIFLQGLLLMPPADRPARFMRWNSLWNAYHDWLNKNAITPLEACLNHVLRYDGIHKVVVGVNSLENIKDIIFSLNERLPRLPESISNSDPELINPSLWQVN